MAVILLFILGFIMFVGEAFILGYIYPVIQLIIEFNGFLGITTFLVVVALGVTSFIYVPMLIYYAFTIEGMMVSNTEVEYEKYNAFLDHITLRIRYRRGFFDYWEKTIFIDGTKIYDGEFLCKLPKQAKKDIKKKIKYAQQQHYKENSEKKYNAVNKFYDCN